MRYLERRSPLTKMAFQIMQLRRFWSHLLAVSFIGALSTGLMLLAASYLYLAPKLPPAAELRSVELQIPLRIYAGDGSLIGEFGEKRRSPVSFDQLPPQFIDAVLAAEDERFFQHGGVDIAGLARAFLELLRYQEIRSGGSTITMQVARNFFLSREQKFLRKFNEIVLAMQIENLLTKEEILTLYLNKIYLGHRSYGAEAAANVYYGKSIGELGLAEWAMIAGLPKAPSAYNPITNPDRARSRRNWILGRMEDAGFISEEEMEAARARPVTASYHGPTPDLEASYFAEMVRQQVVEKVGERAYTDGIRVHTTLDASRQKRAVAALRKGLHEYDERHGWRGPIKQLDVDDLPPLPDQDAQKPEQPDAGDQGNQITTEADAADDIATDDIAPRENDPLALWAKKLDQLDTLDVLTVALVAEVTDEYARVVTGDAGLLRLPFQAVEWARPWVNTNVVGDAPGEIADVLSVGDAVYLRQVENISIGEERYSGWRLAQIPQAQGALVSLDPENGAVQALQGGYSYGLSKYNRVVQGARQVGSAFKPFIYSSALDNGLTPATLINDAPIVFEDEELETAWRPTGASSRFYGPTRLREALYRSLNLVSIRVLKQVGVGNALETLERLGLPSDRFSRDLSLALGSATVTPMELATAYCIFANGGFRVEPWFVTRVVNDAGDTLWQAPHVQLCEDDEDCRTTWPKPVAQAEENEQDADAPQSTAPTGTQTETTRSDEPSSEQEFLAFERVLDPRTAWLMDSMMRDVVKRGTGRRALALGRSDVAGKTGTTNDQVDAWFSGYAPALVATAWVGFDNPATLGRGEYGGRAALPIWIDYMAGALEGVPEQVRAQPPGLISVRINPESGKRAQPGRGDAIFEYFREENVPEMEEDNAPGQSGDSMTPEHLF
jgi:penicillin-binding protein 1A